MYKIIFLLALFQLSVAALNKDNSADSLSGFGKMWMFDNPPTEYLESRYGFKPDSLWLENVRLSSLRIPGCTASFVSEDGLIMTNHHCSEWHRDAVESSGEDLKETGFYAEDIEDERPVPGMFAYRLDFIKDVTEDVLAEFRKVGSNTERNRWRKDAIERIQKKYSEETGLECNISVLYNGAKYSVYGYRKFTDIRLVFIPEKSIAYFGGDFDNFTFPRYNLDCTFFRVYDTDGKPLKTKNYFKWSDEGPKENEVIFTVGNPGRTERLFSVSQLEFLRDVRYRNTSFQLDQIYYKLDSLKIKYPARALEFEEMRTSIGNGQKVYRNIMRGLTDDSNMQKKRDAEQNLIDFVNSDVSLKEKYSSLWKSLTNINEEQKRIETRIAAMSTDGRIYPPIFQTAKSITAFVKERKASGENKKLSESAVDSLLNSFMHDDIDPAIDIMMLEIVVDFINLNIGTGDTLFVKFAGNSDSKKAVESILDRAYTDNRDEIRKRLRENPESLLDITDPFIYLVLVSEKEIPELRKLLTELNETEEVLRVYLGEVQTAYYGLSIPSDANFTLRLSDGVLKNFEYNGTIAPLFTTYYGLFDRYYSFNKQYPWNLGERWLDLPDNFDLATPFNFVSDNDIVGGNSGSPIINKDGEIVGLAFDGNLNSIIGSFIYVPEDNRCVAVDSRGIIEAVEKIYKAKKLADEIKSGKID